MTKQDYMHLPKERLAELLVERDNLEETIEDKIAEKLAELLSKQPIQLPIQPNPYNPNPFQPITVVYGCPADYPDITYTKKCNKTMSKQDKEKEKAKELAEVLYNISCNGHLSKQDLFHYLMEMSAWKEQQFAKHGYTKEQLRKMGFGFTLNGDIITSKDEEEMLTQYIKYKEQQMIDRAKEFISTWFYEHPHTSWLICSDEFKDLDDCLERLKKEMKEEN